MWTFLIERLIGVEEELRKEQQEMQSIVIAKQQVIEAQERRIQSLDNANARLLAALTQLKDRYRNPDAVAPPSGDVNISSDNGTFRSSSC